MAALQRAIAEQVPLPTGSTLAWSGQFEDLQHALERLQLMVPATLAVVFLLIYLVFGRFDDAALITFSLPLALVGGSAAC